MGHTPGQWYLTANGACFNLWSDQREQHHAILIGMTYQVAGEHEANARHIVACVNAHDALLAACEEALCLPGLCEGIGYDGDLDNVSEEMREEMLDARAWRDGIVERVNAAIAKAKGA